MLLLCWKPLLEIHHYVFILPVLYLHLRRWMQGRMEPGFVIPYSVAWVLMSIYYPVIEYFNEPFWVEMYPLFVNYWLLVFSMVEVSRLASHQHRMDHNSSSVEQTA